MPSARSLLRDTDLAELPSGPMEYRHDKAGDTTVLICHGGHLRAEISLGEDPFVESGWSVLVPSRPGYGRTPSGRSPGDQVAVAEHVAELCAHLGVTRVHVVGVSAGAPLAVALAATRPDLVSSLVLQSARSSLPWPDLVSRVSGEVMFHPMLQMLTWTGMQASMAFTPGLGLRTTLGAMSTLPADTVLADLTAEERVAVQLLFRAMSSGRGFHHDLHVHPDPQLEVAVPVPTLVIASPTDGSVPFKHSQHLARTIPGATLVASPSLSHLIWYGTGARETDRTTQAFLAAHR